MAAQPAVLEPTATPTTTLDETTETEDGPVAHIVRTKPGEDAAAKVLQARIEGTPIEALCGHTWVPSRSQTASGVSEVQGHLRGLPQLQRRVERNPADVTADETMDPTHEIELTEPVSLCLSDGKTLNPRARGWSRQPLHRANMRGVWGRTKRWDYWAILSRDLVSASSTRTSTSSGWRVSGGRIFEAVAAAGQRSSARLPEP